MLPASQPRTECVCLYVWEYPHTFTVVVAVVRRRTYSRLTQQEYEPGPTPNRHKLMKNKLARHKKRGRLDGTRHTRGGNTLNNEWDGDRVPLYIACTALLCRILGARPNLKAPGERNISLMATVHDTSAAHTGTDGVMANNTNTPTSTPNCKNPCSKLYTYLSVLLGQGGSIAL